MRIHISLPRVCALMTASFFLTPDAMPGETKEPVKIFLLGGQSNKTNVHGFSAY